MSQIDLFRDPKDSLELLPRDGRARLYLDFWTQSLFEALDEAVDWERDQLFGETVRVDLPDGSLLLMLDCQARWRHAVLPTRKPVGPRINLTFRHIAEARRPGA